MGADKPGNPSWAPVLTEIAGRRPVIAVYIQSENSEPLVAFVPMPIDRLYCPNSRVLVAFPENGTG